MNYNGDAWNGTLGDVAQLRCDGLVELAYERNGIPVWGALEPQSTEWRWDMWEMPAFIEHNTGGNSDDLGDQGDSIWAHLYACTQGGFADQYIAKHFFVPPSPAFRGRYWETGMRLQTLPHPVILAPEHGGCAAMDSGVP